MVDLKRPVLSALIAVPCAGCARDQPAPKATLVDCGRFESLAKEIPGFPDGAYRDKRSPSEIGYLTEIAVRWCVSASATWKGGREAADRSVQLQLFRVPRLRDNEAAPVKPEHAAAIGRLTSLAEQMLCPHWRSVPYERADALTSPEAVRISCRR